jgi:phosphocarrier protein
MTEQTVLIVNPLGLHARPAAQFVKLANTFASEIEVLKDGDPVNGKSIMGVMILAAECGSSVTVRASGSDEAAAVAALVELVSSGFGES